MPEGVFLSASARRPGSGGLTRYPFASVAEFAEVARQAESAGLVAAVTAVELLGAAARPLEPLSSVIVEHLDRLHREWAERIRRDQAARRLWQVAGLVLTCARGAAQDGLLTDPDGFAAIDHLDFREWLAAHGAAPETLGSPLVRGMYDLVFAYEGGDTGTSPGSPPGSASSWPRSCSSSTAGPSSGRCGPAWARWCSPPCTRRCASAASGSSSSAGSTGSICRPTGGRSRR